MSPPKLGDILISQGVIDEEKLIAALSDQRAFGGKLGRTLVDLGYVTEDQLVAALSRQLGLETVDLDTAEIDAEGLSLLPLDVCERYGVFPVRIDTAQRVLWVATAEPDRAMLQEVAQIAQYTLEPILSSMSAIDRAVRQYYFGEKTGPKGRRGEPLTAIPGDAPPPRPKPARAPAPALPDPLDDEMPEASIVGPGDGLSGVAPSPAPDAVEELRTLLYRIEKAVTAQGRAFRALVEILQEKGIVRRGELGSRTSKQKPG